MYFVFQEHVWCVLDGCQANDSPACLSLHVGAPAEVLEPPV